MNKLLEIRYKIFIAFLVFIDGFTAIAAYEVIYIRKAWLKVIDIAILPQLIVLTFIVFYITVKVFLSKKSSKEETKAWILIVNISAIFVLFKIFSLHVEIDFFIHRLLYMEETGISDRMDDLITFSGGVIILFLIKRYYVFLKINNETKKLLILGLTLFFISCIFDMATNREDFFNFFTPVYFSVIMIHTEFLEEILGLISSSIFLVGVVKIYTNSYR